MKSKYKFRHCIGVSNDIAFAPQAAANWIKNELFGKISIFFRNVRTRNIEERCFRETKNAVDTILCGKQSRDYTPELPEKHTVVNLVMLDDGKYLTKS